MIGKLIKHEMKSGARRMGNIYLAAAIACGAMLFSAFFKSGFMRFVTSAAVVVIAAVAVVDFVTTPGAFPFIMIFPL